MATRSQLLAALDRADQAGDADAARDFASLIKNNRFDDAPESAAPSPAASPQLAAVPQDVPQAQPEAAAPTPELANPALKESAQDVGFLEGAGRTVLSGYNRGFAGVSRALADAVPALAGLGGAAMGAHEAGTTDRIAQGADEIALALQGGAETLDERAEELSVRNPEAGTFDSPTAFALTAGESLGQMAPGLALGPLGGSAFVAGDVYGASLEEGAEMGLDESQSRKRAATLAALELVTEKIPLESFLKAGKEGFSGAVGKVLQGTGLEATQEALVTAAQMTLDRFGFDQEDAFKDGWKKLAESAAVGGAIGGVLSGPAAVDGYRGANPEETPDGSDDVAAGVERIDPTLDGAFSNPDPEDQFTDPETDDTLPPWASELDALGLDTSNIAGTNNEQNSDGTLGPTEQQPDGAEQDRGVDGLLGPTEGQPGDDSVEGGGLSDNEDGSRQPDGLGDEPGLQESGQGSGPLSPALSDRGDSREVQPAEVGLAPESEAQQAGIGVDAEVGGQPATLALNEIPVERPELAEEDEIALGQELGVLDSRGEDIEEGERARVLDILEREADEGVEAPAKEFAEPPNYPEPRLQEPFYRDRVEQELSSVRSDLSGQRWKGGEDLLADIAADGGINAQSYEDATLGADEDTKWVNKNPDLKGRTGGKPIFRRNGQGLKLDEVREVLAEYGYVSQDQARELDHNDIVGMLEKALNGETFALNDSGQTSRDWSAGAKLKDIEGALNNALAGKRMGARQQSLVDALLNHHEGPVGEDGAIIPELEELYDAEGAELWAKSGYDPAAVPDVSAELRTILEDSSDADGQIPADLDGWLTLLDEVGRDPATQEIENGLEPEVEPAEDAGEGEGSAPADAEVDASSRDGGEVAADPAEDGASSSETLPAEREVAPEPQGELVDDAAELAEQQAMLDAAAAEQAQDEALEIEEALADTEAGLSVDQEIMAGVADAVLSDQPVDLAGPVNANQQAIADQSRAKDEARNKDTGAPIDVDGGLFSAEAGSPDLFSAETITAKAERADPNPSEAQIEADNYRKGEPIHWKGRTLVIETPKGVNRVGWDIPMAAHYGDIKGTTGNDGDALDAFIGDKLDTSQKVFIKNQLAPDGAFDEHKILVGFSTKKSAVKAYSDSYDTAPKGSVVALSPDELVSWLNDGNHTEPYPVDTVEIRAIRQLRKRIAVHEKILDCVKS